LWNPALMLSPPAAAAAIVEHAPHLPIIPVALRDAAGCVLRQPVIAERDQPPFDRVAMDGIAIASSSVAQGHREFRIAGTQAAWAAPHPLIHSNECIEIMTGAMLPIGCDCVVPVERITVNDGVARLADDVVVTPWLNLHRRGIDCRAGAEVLRPGSTLGAPEVAVLASAGLVHVQVSRMPRIVVISTGDELIEPGNPMTDWQIRRSNVYGVLASLRNHGFTRLADDHIADEQQVLRERLRKHLDTADVLILSGGVSMGKFDFVPTVLAELGVTQVFHKIAQRPGKPMWFGVRHDGKAVYALPGNPVSTLVCMARYVLPGLRAALGINAEPTTVQLMNDCKVLPTLTTLLAVRLTTNIQGITCAHPQPTKGSGDFTSLIGAHGCVELPPGEAAITSGTVVKFFPW
jgi:molybdopterin molybdotransferase